MLIQLVCLYILQLGFLYILHLYNFLSFLHTQQYKLTMIKSFPGYMISTASLSHRLGGLYCLYCLYEVQPFKPPFKIYLSIGMLSTFPHSMVFISFAIFMNIVLLIIIRKFSWAMVFNLKWSCQHSSIIIHMLAIDIIMFEDGLKMSLSKRVQFKLQRLEWGLELRYLYNSISSFTLTDEQIR